jgi:hypothetical protein
VDVCGVQACLTQADHECARIEDRKPHNRIDGKPKGIPVDHSTDRGDGSARVVTLHVAPCRLVPLTTPDMGLRSGTTIIFCINAKDDELCEAVPDLSKKSGRQVTACRGSTTTWRHATRSHTLVRRVEHTWFSLVLDHVSRVDGRSRNW